MMVQAHVSSDRSCRSTTARPSSEISMVDANKMATGGHSLNVEQRARLGSLVRLPHRDSEASRDVAKATALLQAECELATAGQRSTKQRNFLPAWKTTRVTAFVDANLDRSIRIEEMAAIARLSCSHFTRVFHSTVGEPPSTFVARRRVERAEHLILHTDKPLAQIALDCGMADQSHLTKLFRRTYGMSPGKWRKLQHGSETAHADRARQ